jgi:AraC-like DNA-binding protein
MLTDFSRNLELVEGLETEYLRILYYELPPKFCDVYRSYEYTRLCTILEGEKSISVNQGDLFTYNKNEFLLLPPASSVRMNIAVPTKALVFELSNNLIEKVCEKICLTSEVADDALIEDIILCAHKTPALKGSVFKIETILTQSHRNKEFLLDLLAQELVYNLVQVKNAHLLLNSRDDSPIYKAIKYMTNNCLEPFSIKQLAADVRMSESNFCQYFKKVTGITPKEYLTNLKLAKAKDLLKHANVTEVALDLGYENISHFIALFRTKFGITPKQYKMMWHLQ